MSLNIFSCEYSTHILSFEVPYGHSLTGLFHLLWLMLRLSIFASNKRSKHKMWNKEDFGSPLFYYIMVRKSVHNSELIPMIENYLCIRRLKSHGGGIKSLRLILTSVLLPETVKQRRLGAGTCALWVNSRQWRPYLLPGDVAQKLGNRDILPVTFYH